MDVYRKGILGKLAKYAVKKYKGYRQIPDHIIEKSNKIIIICHEFYWLNIT